MRSDVNPEAATGFELDCPSCGAPMEIIDRFTLYGVPEPVEHVKVRCAVGHWYTIPTDWFASPDRIPRAHAPARQVTATDHGASVAPLSRM
jgi:hypothetical protein